MVVSVPVYDEPADLPDQQLSAIMPEPMFFMSTADETQELDGLATTRVGSPVLVASYQADVPDDMERFNLAPTANAQGAVSSHLLLPAGYI